MIPPPSMTELLTCVDQLDYIIYDDGSMVASTDATSLARSTVYGTFSFSDFLYIDALKGRQYLPSRIVRDQLTIRVSSKSSSNIGAIVGGVVAGVVVVLALIWYLRRWGIPRFLRCKPKSDSTVSTPGSQTSEPHDNGPTSQQEPVTYWRAEKHV